ncbi:NADH-quinone oxidoreductase subunit M [Flavobacterium branchiophilum NBRC 15030 = ATCC 35035]|uniref:NADH dehydrogenase subunit M n=1 Tax=Flavobacterium branchiophilum TaxID=55197 RepID=A0A543G4X0_9FLAO|nr:NADH-quinone oxidoreductase subunit M [Flavobacterium branchiophilum]OXA70496.1 NADH-quinone oxidoreductase subunit M [Flavobacterium branchiophilum NBRC 15030 = ATCC 35035]TQM41131.1 NADH dehydrogenase subunit M [Flavobacterium branchiophilum]GEM55559.1 NADH-quinone oxidoreductase subunit M [Flavobacterium branchiophilum NBRC 15030 = ATCC 35035]
MNSTIILIILLVGALATFFAGNKLASKIALFFGVTSFVATLMLLDQFVAGQNIDFIQQWIAQPNISFALKADGLSLAMVLLTTALTPIIILSGFGNQFENAKSLYSLILFMAFAMVGTFLAQDGLLYYVFWELSLIPIYFIALLWGNGDAEERKKAVVKFFIFTLAGSLFMLIAFVYLYQKAGSLMLDDLYKLNISGQEQAWIFVAFFLAYAIKIPIIPFHTWQANVYQKAPTVGTMLLSGIMLKMGLYSVIRWQLPIVPYAAKFHVTLMLILGIIGTIYGSIVALRQKDLKKLLAYSSLAHVGLIAAGAYSLTLDGLKGAVLQMIAHGFVVVGLFFVAEIIYRRYNTRLISDMGGVRVHAPKFTSLFLILVLASVALPSTFNFVGEFTVLYALFQVNIGYAIFGGLTIILGAYYMLKMFQNVMLGPTNAHVFQEVCWLETFVLVIIVAVLFFFGLYSKPITDLITPSLENILNAINR